MAESQFELKKKLKFLWLATKRHVIIFGLKELFRNRLKFANIKRGMKNEYSLAALCAVY